MGAKIMQANKNKQQLLQDPLQTEQELTIRKHFESTFQLLKVSGLLNENTSANIKRVMLETFQKFEIDRQPHGAIAILDLPKMSDTGSGGSGDTSPVVGKGRMSAYAFFVKICREEYEQRNSEMSFDCSECARKCPERWKEMAEIEKKRFQDMADIYTGYKEEEKRSKKEVRRELPKNPRCMFYWFCEEWRPILKKSHPEYGLGDISQTLGRLWRDADNELKMKYDLMAEEDKKRYEREMSDYKRDLGIDSDEDSE